MAKSSFNAFGTVANDYENCHVPVWLGTVSPVPVGGVLASGFKVAGALYGAGTPVYYASKTITPLVAFKVVSLTAGDPNDTVVVYPCVYGKATIIPAAGDKLQKLGATFAATAKAAAVIAVTALTGDDAGKYSFTVAHSATLDSLEAGDYLVYSAAASAGSSKSMANQPNGYLYNDIYFGDIDVTAADAAATGAVVVHHPEGLIINLTSAAPFKAQMAAAVPQVYQV